MNRRWLFGFFIVSGFCSLVCEVVWLRLAMAQYGVTTALTSIVVSVFMAGLALGSFGGGRLGERLERHPSSLLRLYALAETLIALSASVVPQALNWGRELLATTGAGWDSGAYHVASASIIALAMTPFCACMGATFPLAVSLLRLDPRGSRAFSYLYLANVIGATTGALLSAFVLIEILGFGGTLALVSGLNALLGATALALSVGVRQEPAEAGSVIPSPTALGHRPAVPALVALFTTGLVSLGMEIVWFRQLTPYLGTVVYTFATIVGLYLGATFLGSALYRRWAAAEGRERVELPPAFWALLGLSGLLPLIAADPRAGFPATLVVGGVARAVVAIVPFCGLVGFLTPLLTDQWSGGAPRRVGSAYALNILGCILGPLAVGFGLLPLLGERGALLVLAAPLLAAAGARGDGRTARSRAAWLAAGLAGAALLALLTQGPESRVPGALVRHDSVATVTVFGEGLQKQIQVNGIGMTRLTPITKMMAHLALGFNDSPPRSALVVCFGMGTSVRSVLSWNVSTTAVELVPSVPAFFDFFHPDAPELLRSPLARIVIDDGRRFLERSHSLYDAIIVDPPPPVEAAASSLLYSREFYQAAIKRLAHSGVLQQWIPGMSVDDPTVVSALVKALGTSFPHIRAFRSIERWGIHLLASRVPLSQTTAADLAARLPSRAAADLLEWGPEQTSLEQFAAVMDQELSVDSLISRAPRAAPLSDDRPINEYFIVRRLRQR